MVDGRIARRFLRLGGYTRSLHCHLSTLPVIESLGIPHLQRWNDSALPYRGSDRSEVSSRLLSPSFRLAYAGSFGILHRGRTPVLLIGLLSALRSELATLRFRDCQRLCLNGIGLYYLRDFANPFWRERRLVGEHLERSFIHGRCHNLDVLLRFCKESGCTRLGSGHGS